MYCSRAICLVLVLVWLVVPALADNMESNAPLPPAKQKMAGSSPAVDPPLPNVSVPEQRRRSTTQIATRSALPNTGISPKKAGESTPWAAVPPQRSGDRQAEQPPVLLTSNTGEEQWYTFKGHHLTPPGERGASSFLYAPSQNDDPDFRYDVWACSGVYPDYFDPRVETPTVELLATYDVVFTWADYPYADNEAFGDNLAAYVDAGGTVILGQWCLPTATNWLAGGIMDAVYCPVTGTTVESGDYNQNGYDCVHDGITAYGSSHVDVVLLQPDASFDGTFNNPSYSPAVVWRADRRVYYSPGNTAGAVGTGEWVELLCNMIKCRDYGDILFAPANVDDPVFREAITASCGLTVEYYDARLATPSLERLANYDLVMTFPIYPYADNTVFGDNLAAYVDAGGVVVLGQYCLPTAVNWLAGAIMEPDYCPVTGTSYEFGAFNYLGDGTDCIHGEITSCTTEYIDVVTPLTGALWDGTFDNPSSTPAVIWREDQKVYYTPGNMGFFFSSGQWNDLICNIYNCREFGEILYAPSEDDDPAFREALTVSCGRSVDYFDTRLSTPSLDRLANYELVITWTNYGHDDNVLFGDTLAEYVDVLGGTVILGQFCLHTGGYNRLDGAIMDPDHCPVTGTTYDHEFEVTYNYNNDGFDCALNGVNTLTTDYIDVVTPVAGAQWTGTFDNPSTSIALVWRPDRRVYYSPGNTGLTYGGGQWADLVCNVLDCREFGDILFAPSNDDDPDFRSDMAIFCGLDVEYFDARLATPSPERLANYPCVMTWANYPYADSFMFGDHLAAYVDGGGKVILGQWCLPTAGNHLDGAILDPAYCPATAASHQNGNYNNDGTDCIFDGVSTLSSGFFDVITPVAGALTDGTFDNISNSPAAAWRADRRVYYSPGNTGLAYSTGQWPDLVCRMFHCVDPSGTLDCGISAIPSSGVLPFTTQFTVYMANTYDGQIRRMAGRIHTQLASGAWYPNWRVGYTNIAPLDAYITNFNFDLPNFSALVGNNTFQLVAEDVTPPPFNQPPYPMSGDTCSDAQVITGIAP